MTRAALALFVVTTACHGANPPSPNPTDRAAPNPAPPDPPEPPKFPTDVATAPDCPAPAPPIALPCDEVDPDAITTTGADKLGLVQAKWDDLPGWTADDHAAAVPAFLRSCEQLAGLRDRARVGAGPYGGRARDWREACRAAARVPAGDAAAARAFFEAQFTPYAAHGGDGPTGKMTGYYVQEMNGSKRRGGAYQFPLYARPPDLVSIQLSEFVHDGRSRRVWGRVDAASGKVVRYPVRSEIRKRGRGGDEVLLWVDSPVDAIAVEIEGSGKAKLPDGSVAWVAFAGKNGRRGRLGGVLRAVRDLAKERGEGAWSAAEIERYFQISDLSDSMVFFEIEARAGAIGTQDVVLTPRRSLAVDRAVISLSTPVWIDTQAPTGPRGRREAWQHLLIAQDTGGAILGSVRGDIYWGDDRDAAAIGGRMYTDGRMWLLLPRSIRVQTRPAPAAASEKSEK